MCQEEIPTHMIKPTEKEYSYEQVLKKQLRSLKLFMKHFLRYFQNMKKLIKMQYMLIGLVLLKNLDH